MNSVTPRAALDVVASTRFEGEAPSPEAVALVERVISGELSADEAVAARLDTLRRATGPADEGSKAEDTE